MTDQATFNTFQYSLFRQRLVEFKVLIVQYLTSVRGDGLLLFAYDLAGDHNLLWFQGVFGRYVVQNSPSVSVLHGAVRTLYKFQQVRLEVVEQFRQFGELRVAVEAGKH